jgi:predicted PurR-regulated permease PerM
MADTQGCGFRSDSHRTIARHTLVAQSHIDDEGPIARAERLAAQQSSSAQPHGVPGPRFDRSSPFYVGMTAAAGVAVTYAVVRGLAATMSTLLLIGVAFLVAVELEPAVSWLVARGLPRGAAVSLVIFVVLGVLGGCISAVIPPLVEQTRQFTENAKHFAQRVHDHSSWIGKLNDQFHLQQRITDAISRSGGSTIGEVAKAGTAVFGTLADLLIISVLSIYFLVEMPRVRAALYRLVPNARRPRAILIGDEVYAKVGAYVLGNLVVSVLTGLATFIWLVTFGVPYPLMLGILVALLDLIPFGSSVAGVIVALVALTISLPVSLATLAFFGALRLVEDYLLVPKIIGRVLDVPAVGTLLAVLVGGAMLGIVGAVVAIPVAAAIQLLAQEVLFPRLDER